MLKKILAFFKPKPSKWSTPEVINSLSCEKIGTELATKVANKLKQDNHLYYSHRDYCGHGLMYKDDSYHIFRIIDADIEDALTLEKFNSAGDFIRFFAKQSDYSMAGADNRVSVFYTDSFFELNNQRLSCKRLIDFCAKIPS